MEFLPICIEVLGPMGPNTLKFLKAICKMISVRSGESRELFFATNHISCLLQRAPKTLAFMPYKNVEMYNRVVQCKHAVHYSTAQYRHEVQYKHEVQHMNP
ncbi:hypothetical protein HELRODRAFT_170141 [Helobdella robusta]|uniref:Uncharacterized protein n=1 Tax=Helobdella robusta TaxID=6412 RepID=T1F2P7_HELRO|nr:hypothetical protein HELRODRAFT_170141 [Helobdella robusta]ESO07596.1 hypothetical protein HELRODRAFT_170141 [Helobdella robusta]